MDKLKGFNIPMFIFVVLSSKLIYKVNSKWEVGALFVISLVAIADMVSKNWRGKAMEKELLDGLTKLDVIEAKINSVEGAISTVKVAQGLRTTRHDDPRRGF